MAGVRRERTRSMAGAFRKCGGSTPGTRWKAEASKGGTPVGIEAQGGGGNGHTRNRAAELGMTPVQVAVPAESRANISSQSFWE